MSDDLRPTTPEPTTVWAVRLGVSNDDFKGTLALEPADLVFTHQDTSVRIKVADIRKVKRTRGSPVLTVEAASDTADGKPARYAFFFAPPPPIKPPPGTGRRKNMRKSVLYLQTEGKRAKETVLVWEQALKDARARS
jgi:hypothetical protein